MTTPSMTDMPSSTRAAKRGSQSWMQRAVHHRHAGLERDIAAAVGRPEISVAWKSPLAPQFSEARDGRVFELRPIIGSIAPRRRQNTRDEESRCSHVNIKIS